MELALWSRSICEIALEGSTEFAATFDKAGVMQEQLVFQGIGKPRQAIADEEGNVYVAGNYRKQLPFGAPLVPEAAGAYIAKYNSDGVELWHQEVDPDGYAMNADHVALGPNGAVYLTGHGTQALSGGATAVGLFVFRFDAATGNEAWRLRGSGSGTYYSDLAVSPDGNVFVSGAISVGGSVNWAGIQLDPVPLLNYGFLVSITPIGGVIGAALHGSSEGRSYLDRILAMPNGDVLGMAQANGRNVLLRYDGAATLQSTTEVVANGKLSLSPEGDIIVAGSHTQALKWGESPELQTSAAPNNRDNLFVGKWTQDGVPVWVRSFGGEGRESASDVIASEDGDIYIIGQGASGAIAAGGDTLPSFGRDDIIVASYSSDGEHRWSHSIGSAGDESPRGIAVGNDGVVTALGMMRQQIVTELGVLPMSSHLDAADTSSGSGALFGIRLRK